MSSGQDRDDVKRELREWIDLARSDQEIRELLRELITTVERDGRPSRSTKKVREPSMNPFEAIRELGRQGLERELQERELEELLQIVKYYGLDPSRKSHKWKNPDRVRELIVERVYDKSVQGDVFSR